MNTSTTQNAVTTILLTALALIAFAANSVLCRLALDGNGIDAASFTIIRLTSGAVVLFVLVRLHSSNTLTTSGNWISAFMLFVYAITFSFAYITLDTGTGALILFGSVQITMLLLSIIAGNRLHLAEWLGVIVAFAGFVYLVSPGVTAPSLPGFMLMSMAGIAWGIYTLRGHGSGNPLMDTTGNFVRTVPLIIITAALTLQYAHYSVSGTVYAVLSGGIASGVGYSIWYSALRGLSATRAAAVQLSVPVIAAAGGVAFLSEMITLRLVLSTMLVLGGILLVIYGRSLSAEESGPK